MAQSTALAPERAGAGQRGDKRSSVRGNPWLALLATGIGVMMVALDATVVFVANPHIAKDLNAQLSGLQWVTNGYLLALAVTLIPAGKLADRFGRKKIFIIGIAGFAVMSLAIGLSGSLGLVIFFRVLQGLFGAMLQPASLAILRNAFPAEKLNMAIGIWGATIGIGVASGPIVAGLLVDSVGWESVFYLNVPLGILALLFGLWVIRESRDEESPRSIDFPGVILLSGALFGIVFGLVKAGEHSFGDTLPLVSFAAAAVVGVAFVIWELRAPNPVLPLGLFKNSSLAAGTVLTVLGMFGLFGTLFFITLYMQSVNGLSPVEAGVRMLPMTGVFMVSSPLAGALTAKFGPRFSLVLGTLLTAVALFGLSQISADEPFIGMLPWFVLIGLAFGFVIVGGTEAIVGNAPMQLAGVAGGMQQTAFQLGGVLGNAVLGTIMSSTVGDKLFGHLTGQGVPAAEAEKMEGAKQLVSQGGAPVPPGADERTADAITTGSNLAFMDGFQSAMIVGGVISIAAAGVALIVKRGVNETEGSAVI